MNEPVDLAERRSALDAFASTVEGPGQEVAVQFPPAIGPQDRVFGAQQVAVHRNERAVLQKLSVLAAAAGTDWYYRFPVAKKDGGTEFIEGPSIKLANDVARIYGNCDVDTRVVDLGDSWLFYARFTDFETGYSLTRPFQQRKSQRGMKADAGRAQDIAFQIGASKAIRNVVVNALQTFSDYAFEEARSAIVTKVGNKLDHYRGKVLDRLASMGIEVARVETAVGRPSRDWLAPDVARIIAELQAIGDGMATADETYPPLKAAPAEQQKKDFDKFAEGEQKPQPEAKETPQDEKPVETGVGAAKSDEAVRPETAASTPATSEKGPNTDQTPADKAGNNNDTLAGKGVSNNHPPAEEQTGEDDPAAYGIDPIVVARKRGWQAREDGVSRRAVPPEYRSKARDAEAKAWHEGHDDHAAGKPRPE